MNILILILNLISQIDTVQINELKAALKDAGDNRITLEVAIKEAKPEWTNDLIWLIIGMPHLDRLEMKKEILLENVALAHQAFERWRLPDSLCREYVLPYRFSEEAIVPWRIEFYERFNQLIEDNIDQTVLKINQLIAHDFKIIEKKEFLGPEPSPLHLLRLKIGTREQAGILLAAALRSIGIPTRFMRCPIFGEEKGGATWVEFNNGKKWQPAYPLNPEGFSNFHFYEINRPGNVPLVLASSSFSHTIVTANYTAVGYLKLRFIRKDISLDKFEHFSIAVFNDGAYLPLDELLWYSQDPYFLILGNGNYLLEAGLRTKGGNPYIHLLPVNIVPGETLRQTINLDIPLAKLALEDFFIRTIDSIPEIQLVDKKKTTYNLRDLSRRTGVIFYFFDLRTEPPSRMIELVNAFASENNIELYGIYLDPPETLKEMLPSSITILAGDRNLIKTKLKIKEFPSTMFFINGGLIYWSEGYNLNIKDELAEILSRIE